MIEELHIKDLALIEEAWLELSDGLTVLTGETGAGKTVLLSALKLIMGDRADSSAVRYGAAEALVEGRLSIPASQLPSTEEGADATGGQAGVSPEVVVSRRITAQGRSRCVLNGEMVPVGTLEQSIGPAIELHGQHDHQALLRPATHVTYLDRYGHTQVDQQLEQYRTALADYRARTAELADIQARIARSGEEIEVNRLVLAEIDRVDPSPGEDEELEAALPAMLHAEEIARATLEARSAIAGDGGAAEQVAGARAALERVAGHVPTLADVASTLGQVGAALDDVGFTLGSVSVDRFDEVELNTAMSRLSALDGLKKRFGPTLDVVLDKRESLRRSLDLLESGSVSVEAAARAQEVAREALTAAAAELQGARATTAAEFSREVLVQAAGLELGAIQFEVSFTELPFERWNDTGSHTVEFRYSPSAEVPPRPLAKIASGGEISRVMLSLKTVLGPAGGASTLVFDEVDAGIGGGTATAVGQRLADLADDHQVLVVTHLAQVAAFADTHYVVRKISDGGATATVVVPVEGEQRVRELARMLSGEETEVAMSHARELLAQRGTVR